MAPVIDKLAAAGVSTDYGRTTDGLRTGYGSTGPQLSWNSVTTPLLVKPVSWKVLWAVP